MTSILPRAEDCALLLVDLQVGAMSSIRTMSPARLKDNAIALATLAQLHAIPAVLTAGRKPGVGGVFLPELKALLPGHVYVERTAAAAFDDPGVARAVAATGRTTVIVAGIATDIGLLFAALGAKAAGLDVIAVLDVAGTTDAQAESIARHRLWRAGVSIAGWASLATGLMHDFAGPHGLATMALLAQRMDAAGRPFDEPSPHSGDWS